MPLFYQQHINQFTRLAIWQIEEPEAFFLQSVPLHREVSHPHKRVQHLAGRYLLRLLFPDFPLSEILIADTRKPFLKEEQYHFSISHCGDYAAAIVSDRQRVGIDIEKSTESVERIRNKFLSAQEQSLIRHMAGETISELNLLTMLWSAKEAVFKWYSLGGIDFKGHMQLPSAPTPIRPDQWELNIRFLKEQDTLLTLHCRQWNDLLMSFVVA